MSVNYSILANNPVWNGNTKVSAATAVAATTTVPVPMALDELEPRTVIVSNTGTTNLFLTNQAAGTTGILLQPGAAITVGVSGTPLYVRNNSAGAGEVVSATLA
jgi:hypothetical protein